VDAVEIPHGDNGTLQAVGNIAIMAIDTHGSFRPQTAQAS
jgi:hypothetical protein